MAKSEERWRRPGIRLAILALVAVGIYFLALFVKQSWNLYQLTGEVRAQEGVVAGLEGENRRLGEILALFSDEEGRRTLVKESLPYKEPGERVVFPIEAGEDSPETASGEQPSGSAPEDVASLPAWQQWWRVIFTPGLAAGP